MMNAPAAIVAFWALASALHAAELASAIPRSTRQLVVVTSDSWTSPRATLRRYTRASSTAPWQRVGEPVTALIGENGLGWGRGLHAIPEDAARLKREGDRRAPAGVFRITGAFGQTAEEAVGPLRIAYRRVGPGWLAVDDPASRHYNRIVERARIARPDWRSAERLDAGAYYRLALDVAHNPRHVPGAGSCIFLHEWTTHRTGTAGCTVLRSRDLLTLVRWLDAAAAPVLMQAPRGAIPGW